MLDLHRLKIFKRIAELKSYSLAAKELYLTQPTVSQHIAYLEDHIGLKLFDRTPKGVSLTRAGEILYKFAKRIIALTEEAQQAIDLYKGLRSGSILIGASTIPGEYILPAMLGRFTAAYPGISVSVKISDTEETLSLLMDYSIDVGIVGAKVENRQIDYIPFDKDELIVIVPFEHKWRRKTVLSVDELTTEPFVLREKGSGTRITFERALEAKGVHPHQLNISAEMGSSTALKQAVKSGLGISVISKKAVADELKQKQLKGLTIPGLELTRSFYLALHRKKSLSPVSQVFVDFIRRANMHSSI